MQTKSTQPNIQLISQQDTEIVIALDIPENLHYFKGHFQDNPLLPGVVQIDWVIQYTSTYFKITPAVKYMENIKFKHPIKPNDQIMLSLKYNDQNHQLHFSYYNHNQEKYSSGKINFQSPN